MPNVGTPSVANQSSGASLTVSHSTIASGSNRKGLVRIGWNNHAADGPLNVDDVTWDGVSITFLGAAVNEDDGAVDIWYDPTPNTGTVDVTASWDRDPAAGAGRCILAQDYTDAGDPTGFQGTLDESSPYTTPAITSGTDDIAVCAITLEGGGLTMGTGNGQTLEVDYDNIGPSGQEISFNCSYKSGNGATVTLNATGVNDHGVAAGCNIPHAAPSGLDLVRLIGETEQGAEAWARARARSNHAAETLEIAETSIRSRALRRILQEICEDAESAVRVRTVVRRLDRTLEGSEVLVRVRDRTRPVAENAELADGALFGLGVSRDLSETLEISETSTRARARSPGIAEAMEIPGGRTVSRAIARELAENADLAQSLARVRTAVRKQDETELATEVMTRTRALTRIWMAILPVLEAISPPRVMAWIRDEANETDETPGLVIGRMQIIAETMGAADATVAFLSSLGPAFLRAALSMGPRLEFSSRVRASLGADIETEGGS